MAENTRKVWGDKAVVSKLRAIAKGVKGIAADQALQHEMLMRIRARYDRQETPEGTKWKALAPATLVWRKSMGILDNPILFGTGMTNAQLKARAAARRRGRSGRNTLGGNHLKFAIDIVSARASEYLSHATGLGFSIGVKGNDEMLNKAKAHQWGRGRVPQRKFLGYNASDVRAVRKFMDRRIDQIKAMQMADV